MTTYYHMKTGNFGSAEYWASNVKLVRNMFKTRPLYLFQYENPSTQLEQNFLFSYPIYTGQAVRLTPQLLIPTRIMRSDIPESRRKRNIALILYVISICDKYLQS